MNTEFETLKLDPCTLTRVETLNSDMIDEKEDYVPTVWDRVMPNGRILVGYYLPSE